MDDGRDREREHGKWVNWKLDNHEDRLRRLEEFNLGVFDNRLTQLEHQIEDVRKTFNVQFRDLERKIDDQSRILWTIAASLIAAAITLAVAIASGTVG